MGCRDDRNATKVVHHRPASETPFHANNGPLLNAGLVAGSCITIARKTCIFVIIQGVLDPHDVQVKTYFAASKALSPE